MTSASARNYLQAFSSIQWLKNGLIFIPAIFAAVDWSTRLTAHLLLAFWAFSLIASAVYLNNDLADQETDQLHPEKKKRAIASGAISRENAIMLLLIFSTVGLGTLFLIGSNVALCGVVYLMINGSYSAWLKKIPLLDLACILSGYFIRLLIGREIANVPLSPWLVGFVGLLALYLVLMKRRGDVHLFKATGILHRKTVSFYAKLALPQLTMLLANGIVLFFAAYIHFVFVAYPIAHPILPYVTIPLTYIALISYHKSVTKNNQKDPILVLLQNYWSLGLFFISFLLLIISLYPSA